MAVRSNTHCWEVHKFSFSTENQAEEWKSFYIRATDILEAVDIDTNTKHET